MLFQYPKQAHFGRVVAKSKIYENAKVPPALKKKFVEQLGKITWQYKLSPETTNLAGKEAAPEIQVFSITQKTEELDEKLLRCIDAAINFPTLFELNYRDQLQTRAAYKRPSDVDSSKWVVGDYFESEWKPLDTERTPLPVSLDLSKLYEQLLRGLIPLPAREGESMKAHADRHAAIIAARRKANRIEKRMHTEKQLNRKVEWNAQLRTINETIAQLTRETSKKADA